MNPAVIGVGIEGTGIAAGPADTRTHPDFSALAIPVAPLFNRPGVGGREITLIETETLDALAKTLNIKLPAVEARRNIATSGAPLNHLVDREFWVGEVRLLGARLCEPCMHLEQLTRLQGVMSGLVHRGGLRARILNEGVIRTGDAIRPA
ncbi:MAG: MOSC domain-containing protein [Candidatus Rokubacteria bacterium]|nr:MOSC domain-containing protein [Candidatus Rokubacteria bacterium]